MCSLFTLMPKNPKILKQLNIATVIVFIVFVTNVWLLELSKLMDGKNERKFSGFQLN